MNNHRKAWTATHIIDLRMWWLFGMFCSEIGERLGRTAVAVSCKAKELNLPPRRKSPISPSIPLIGNVFKNINITKRV